MARELLGKFLVHHTCRGELVGKIVETEAYLGEKDPASHAYKGKKTPRTRIMWGKPGSIYVYFTYGMHYLLNVVTEKEGKAGAVLIRGVEPVKGIPPLPGITRGPAKVTSTFGIDLRYNRKDITQGNLTICEGRKEKFKIRSAPRLGIKKGKEKHLRFYIEGNPWVSRKS